MVVGAVVGVPVGKHELCVVVVVVAGLSSCVVRPIRIVFVVVEVLTAPPGGEGL